MASHEDIALMTHLVRRAGFGATREKAMTAEALVDRCLDLMGPLEVVEQTRAELDSHLEGDGPISLSTEEEYAGFSQRVGDTLALIAATREYQFG